MRRVRRYLVGEMSDTKKSKSVLVAFILGLLLPGVGLLYAAPWLVAGLGAVFALLVYKLFAWIPLVGSVVMGLMALTSAGLNVLYARAYNRNGQRMAVSLADETR